jgi:hypothetical protein
MEMQILHLIEATAVDDVPVDLVVEARAGKRGPVRRFAVVFADQRPERDFTIPCLWFSEAGGVWLDG